jgi:Resolvase, N terminal domain
MSEKIQPNHIEREACVYIRQSTMQQVRTRLEEQRRQYDLRERAQALGFQRVVVIDEDQGRSGTGSVERRAHDGKACLLPLAKSNGKIFELLRLLKLRTETVKRSYSSS